MPEAQTPGSRFMGEAQEPIAYLHDDPNRYDVIHVAVKKLLHDSHDAAGHLHRPVDKSARYTIPLYAHPVPLKAAPPSKQAGASAVPKVTKMSRDFFWNSIQQHHVPTLLLEFEPVPAHSPNDAKGWRDRDAAAAMFTTPETGSPASAGASGGTSESESDARDAARWRAFIGLPHRVRAEWATNLSLAPVLTEWVDGVTTDAATTPETGNPASADDERDAARYRWLRDVGDSTWAPISQRPGCTKETIDKAIDAAIAAQGERHG